MALFPMRVGNLSDESHATVKSGYLFSLDVMQISPVHKIHTEHSLEKNVFTVYIT